MGTVERSDIFFEKLKTKLISLGVQEKLALTIASTIRPVKFEGNTVIAVCKDSFYRDTFIKAKQQDISEVARDCWGPDVEFFIRSEVEPSASVPKKRTRGAAKSNDMATNSPSLLFDAGQKNLPPVKSEGRAESRVESRSDGRSEARSFGEVAPIVNSPQNSFVSDNLASVAPPEFLKNKLQTSFLHASKNINKMSKSSNVTPMTLNEDYESKAGFDSPIRTLAPELTFSTFVRGQSNLVAYSACEAIAKNPGNLTNPVFIYGATGLGKTHLLHSVGNEIQKLHPDWQILYVTSGDFMNELIASIRFSKQESFRNKYRQCDVLLVDDIQFLENKDTTQLEFFHTFNELYQKRKQIVITSDKYPKDIPNIEERLKSRFLQGLISDIEPPSFEDRVAIIESKAKMLGLKLISDVILHIATHVKANVREIQGVLNNLLMTQSMTGQSPTIDSTNALLKRVVRMQGSALDVHSIQKAVSAHFGIKLSELMSQNRSQKFVIPRHIAMFLAKELMDSATTEIAEAFGKKDHTTVMHAITKVRELLEKDASTRAIVNELKRKLDHGTH